ncbi:MAG: sigma-54-dependent Fis family transcriptional regulator [Deltaproteobacteria bacterium]|jgi:DNA-binding NtrC family response regulator|nr:sigma-54-dependent Fis family transcriptional regulator [Deltaproteobacteria bacterium]
MSLYKNTNLLIVDDDDAIVRIFERLAKDRGWTCQVAKSGEEALELLGKKVFEAAVVDIKLPGFTGLQLLEHLKQNNILTEVVMMTGVGSEETAVMAMKRGAYDYLTKPFDDIDRVSIILAKAMERFALIQKLRALERKGGDEGSYEELIGKSKKMQEIFDIIDNIAPTKSTVLIQGESGTGKELVARAIHFRSKRKDKPFVIINCSAIPVHLLESELFGHKKGSFTGAIADKKGLFEAANGGTIFLDEIGEVPPTVQVKLLRVLQEGEVRPVGDNAVDNVDVRMIAATNRDLAIAIKEKRFREDLYYRINVIGLTLPPLRERTEDVPVLAYHFLNKYNLKMKKKIERITVDALQVLQNYSWVGNVRELENVIERAVVLATGDNIEISDLPPRILGESFYLSEDMGDVDISQYPYKEAKRRAMASFNKVYITALLKRTSGNISFASDRAQMDRSNFKKLIKKYGIEVDGFKDDENAL